MIWYGMERLVVSKHMAWGRVPLRYIGCITWTRRGRQHMNNTV
jgi:hypothetical protein